MSLGEFGNRFFASTGVILVNMVISVILGHEKTKIQNILDLGKIDIFSVRTNIYIKNKKWATSFDPLGSCCTRLFKNEMSRDDARLVG